jgi:hypothetical protein
MPRVCRQNKCRCSHGSNDVAPNGYVAGITFDCLKLLLDCRQKTGRCVYERVRCLAGERRRNQAKENKGPKHKVLFARRVHSFGPTGQPGGRGYSSGVGRGVDSCVDRGFDSGAGR